MKFLSNEGINKGTVDPKLFCLLLKFVELNSILGEDFDEVLLRRISEGLDKVLLGVRLEVALEEGNISFQRLVHHFKIS